MAVLLSPRPAVLAAARRAGAQPVVVAPDLSVPSDREGAERRVRTDWRDHPRLVGALGGLAEVRAGRAAVFGFGAASALAAARANEELGLPGTPSSAVTALMDKASLRARVNGLGGRPVSFARCGRADLLPFIANLIGYPCVVKPRAGADGEGVRRILDPADAVAAAPGHPAITLISPGMPRPPGWVGVPPACGGVRVLGPEARSAGVLFASALTCTLFRCQWRVLACGP
ncbi:hypothetical protein [Streptomyces sp. NPDC086023]|uniref:hypothetical protein n=1 Tax=Streptomyces sp. NPDC086023 TaxID=3365746 RepID=UPI0037D741EA